MLHVLLACGIARAKIEVDNLLLKEYSYLNNVLKMEDDLKTT